MHQSAVLERSMTRENALAFVDRHVRIVHAGPHYVRHNDPEGLIVAVTETSIMMRDAGRPDGELRAWDLALIAGAQCLDGSVEAEFITPDAREPKSGEQRFFERRHAEVSH